MDRARGYFQHAETGVSFEYDELQHGDERAAYDLSIGATHLVYVGPWCRPQDGIDRGTRAAIVKRTVAYVAVDEDDSGAPVWERWPIKQHKEYAQ
jgi:hypothetical protein